MATCDKQEFIDEIQRLNPDNKVIDVSSDNIVTCECIIPICNFNFLSLEDNFCFYFSLDSDIFQYIGASLGGALKVFYKEPDKNEYTELYRPGDYLAKISTEKPLDRDEVSIVNVCLKTRYTVDTLIKIKFDIKIKDSSKINNEFAIPTTLGYCKINGTDIAGYTSIVTFEYPKYRIVPCTGEKLTDKIKILNPDKVVNILGNGSIITCECIIPACIECLNGSAQDYPDTRIHCYYFIDPELFSYIEKSTEVSYSINNYDASYTILPDSSYKIDLPTGNNSSNPKYLDFYINNPEKCIDANNSNYTFTKFKFKLKVINIDKLPNEFSITTTFAFEYFETKDGEDIQTGLVFTQLDIKYPKYLIKNPTTILPLQATL